MKKNEIIINEENIIDEQLYLYNIYYILILEIFKKNILFFVFNKFKFL